VVGGGIGSSNGGVELNEDEPMASTSGGPMDTWMAIVDNYRPVPLTFTVHAICVNANAVNTG